MQVRQRLYFKQKVVPAIEKFAPFVEKFLIENGNNGLFLGETVSIRVGLSNEISRSRNEYTTIFSLLTTPNTQLFFCCFDYVSRSFHNCISPLSSNHEMARDIFNS